MRAAHCSNLSGLHRLLAVAVLLGTTSLCLAQQVGYHVSLDTTSLMTASGGPFALDFQLVDGNGTGDANNTVTIQHFHFDSGGALSGSPFTIGGVTGDLSSTLTLTDSAFFNEYTQGFTPGDPMQMDVFVTLAVDTPTPDELSFALLDGNGDEIPTTLTSGALFTLDLTGTDPLVTTGTATGSYAGLGAPVLTRIPTGTTPEPGALALLVSTSGVCGAGRLLRCHRK